METGICTVQCSKSEFELFPSALPAIDFTLILCIEVKPLLAYDLNSSRKAVDTLLEEGFSTLRRQVSPLHPQTLRRCICYTTYQRPHLSSFPSRVQVMRVTRKSLPIIVSGFLRVILVKGTYYPVIYSVRVSFLLHSY